MFEKKITTSIIVYGDVNAVFDDLKKILEGMKFILVSSSRPKLMELTRGKTGILKTKIATCKTLLNISLKEASENEEVNMLFDYEFEIPGIFTDSDKDFIHAELSKIHHELFDSVPSRSVPKFFREFSKTHNV